VDPNTYVRRAGHEQGTRRGFSKTAYSSSTVAPSGWKGSITSSPICSSKGRMLITARFHEPTQHPCHAEKPPPVIFVKSKGSGEKPPSQQDISGGKSEGHPSK
jgi:hypothetical protein